MVKLYLPKIKKVESRKFPGIPTGIWKQRNSRVLVALTAKHTCGLNTWLILTPTLNCQHTEVKLKQNSFLSVSFWCPGSFKVQCWTLNIICTCSVCSLTLAIEKKLLQKVPKFQLCLNQQDIGSWIPPCASHA